LAPGIRSKSAKKVKLKTINSPFSISYAGDGLKAGDVRFANGAAPFDWQNSKQKETKETKVPEPLFSWLSSVQFFS